MTLYVYMPCDDLRGVDYIDEVCKRQFDNSWPAFLRAFVSAEMNKWCPTWIRQNYMCANKKADDEPSEGEDNADAAEASENNSKEATGFAAEGSGTTRKTRAKFVFEEDGEPPADEAEEAATTLDRWKIRAVRLGNFIANSGRI